MSAIDLLVSNGTCFYAIGHNSSSNVIPCGNAALGAYQCCEEGDYCLEFNICYNEAFGTTYLAGCTDWTFSSPSCPLKGDKEDQQLLNLVQCEGTNEGESIVWSACPGPATRTEIGVPEACTCTDADNGIFTATTSVPQVASLPTAIGGTISFAPGHTPKFKGHATMTSTTNNGQATTMTMPVASSSATASSSGGLSKGAKAGIGVGVGVAGVAVIALAALLFTWYRGGHSKHPSSGSPSAYYQSPPPQNASPGYQPVSHTPDTPTGYPAGYVGYKSELPGAPMEAGPGLNLGKSELPAGNLDVATSQALVGHGAPSLFSVTGSTAPTGHASMVSDISRAPSASPPVQYSPGAGQGPDQYGRGPGGGNMSTIAELHG